MFISRELNRNEDFQKRSLFLTRRIKSGYWIVFLVIEMLMRKAGYILCH